MNLDKILIISAGVLLSFYLGIKTFGGISGYSEGTRTGKIEKISKKGIFFKSHEGVMQLGGMVKDSEGGMLVNKWKFSCSSPEVAKEIELKSGQIVTLSYDQWLIAPWWYSTTYDVVEVK